MTTDPAKFVVYSGLDWHAATALAAQIDSGDPKAENLVSPWCSDIQAVELTRQIVARKADPARLFQFGYCPELIAAFQLAIENRKTHGHEQASI